MSREREAALEEMIEQRTQLLAAQMENLPRGASRPNEELLATLFDLDDLGRELDFLRENPDDSEEPPAFVCAPVNAPPHRNSGAVALPEPDPPEPV
jgi:hypothetical protein